MIEGLVVPLILLYCVMHQGHEPAERTSVYTLLSTHVESAKTNAEVKQVCRKPIASYHFNSKGQKILLQKMLSQHFSVNGIRKVQQKLKRILKEYVMPFLPFPRS